ncbi:hypothetical protein F0U61_07505 [Archangium violaceum]|uniref:hypothetical protein n=1 Tax=Archangium violaceum TaxID=83451 RepID=UPI002B2D25B5|nr:hypothetical protein F0U61_07505 [Archangium violaceum]
MHWSLVVGIALLVVPFGTGCPETYGKGGYLDDAMEEDIKEQWRERQREKQLSRTCGDGKPPRDICDDPKDARTCHWGCP